MKLAFSEAVRRVLSDRIYYIVKWKGNMVYIYYKMIILTLEINHLFLGSRAHFIKFKHKIHNLQLILTDVMTGFTAITTIYECVVESIFHVLSVTNDQLNFSIYILGECDTGSCLIDSDISNKTKISINKSLLYTRYI